MNFDYKNYINLVNILKQNNYQIADYHNYTNYDRCVILRHDIDTSLSKAVELAELETKENVKSTYFVLLTSNFYNVASKSSRDALHRIQDLGHEIGIHFDEVAYGEMLPNECVAKVLKEKEILSSILETEVTTVSMHRPSKKILDADLKIPGMVNSYGYEFFHGFKYLSDSRRRWREPADEIIKSGKYKRLHILTHAFWYQEQEESINVTVSNFVHKANEERYAQMAENITNIDSIMRKEEV